MVSGGRAVVIWSTAFPDLQDVGHDFYYSLEQKILLAHFYYMKMTYHVEDEKIYKSGEMNRSFIPK
jgi:hypothetical protein